MRRSPWFAASRDAAPDFLAAYAGRFGRPFPPGLLPDEQLHPVGRDLLRRVHAALACAWTRNPRRQRVELMFGTAAARVGKVLIPFSRPAFLQFAPVGYWAAGFAARPLGDFRRGSLETIHERPEYCRRG